MTTPTPILAEESAIESALREAVGERAARPGEVHRFGNKFAVRGRALDILRALPDNAVDTAIFDPPWMEPRAYPCAQAGRKRGKQHGEKKRSWGDILILQDGMRPVLEELPRVCRAGAMIFCGTVAHAAFAEVMFPAWPTLTTLIWAKPGGPLGSPPVISAHEMILWGRRPAAVGWKDLALREDGAKGLRSWIECNPPPSASRAHPVEKPVDLLRTLIRFSTPSGGRVMDLYAGSFSAARAAALEKTGGIFAEMDADHFGDGLEKFRGGRLL